MRNIPKPIALVSDIFDDCIRSVQNQGLKTRLRTAKPVVLAAAQTYEQKGTVGELFEIPVSNGVLGVTSEEMHSLYRNTFVKSVRTRPIYTSLKKGCKNDMCPLCGQRTVHQLDHYLPVSQHSALAVTPVNLVPACAECNKVKLAKEAAIAEEQTLHPYFDDLTATRWLYATVQQTNPVSLLFEAKPDAGMSLILQARIVHHFKTFELGNLYTSHAGEELTNIRFGLQEIAKSANPTKALRTHLDQMAMSRRVVHLNSWQTAMYSALAESDWFLTQGYRF